jgi:hypothetical protein
MAMRTGKVVKIAVAIFLVILLYSCLGQAAPFGTAFTYQGRLMDASDVANGVYEFEFKLYDAVEDGNQLDGTVAFRGVDVVDGYFTVNLDFGSGVFTGDARWLGIGVRSGSTSDPFTTLIPRQEITASPYALHSLQTHGIFVDDLLNVGVGTQSPTGRLHVDGGKAMSGNLGTDLVLKAQDGGDGWAMQNDGAPGGGIILLPGEGGDEIGAGSPGPDGNVGIGTMSPRTKLEVLSTTGIRVTTGQHANVYGDFKHAYSGGLIINANAGGGWADMSFQTDAATRMFIESGGNVGIGTTSPGTKLHIEGGSDASLSGGGFLVTGSASSTNVVIDDNEIIARNNGSAAKLYLNKGSGNVVVSVLEITGGSDLAEPFDVAGTQSIEPGMVVVIDAENPGKLVVSSEAYDRKVAGIISGAGGINPGMLMGQKGSVANGANPVALTGRVYCLADAAYGAIKPGDLLTTSETPGHAMKVTDHSKAHGAILGKAMSSLVQGQGLVLVLVTLQ